MWTPVPARGGKCSLSQSLIMVLLTLACFTVTALACCAGLTVKLEGGSYTMEGGYLEAHAAPVGSKAKQAALKKQADTSASGMRHCNTSTWHQRC